MGMPKLFKSSIACLCFIVAFLGENVLPTEVPADETSKVSPCPSGTSLAYPTCFKTGLVLTGIVSRWLSILCFIALIWDSKISTLSSLTEGSKFFICSSNSFIRLLASTSRTARFESSLS